MKYHANFCRAQAINSNLKLKHCLPYPSWLLLVAEKVNEIHPELAVLRTEESHWAENEQEKVRERLIVSYHEGQPLLHKENF